jgi:hypothetical protein
MKLRQKSAIVLCVFYVLSVIGLALSLHFCGDTVSSVELAGTAKCTMCGKSEKPVKGDHCCKNTILEVKVKDAHQSIAKLNLPESYPITLFLQPGTSAAILAPIARTFSKIAGKAPPLSARIALHLLNCVFRN